MNVPSSGASDPAGSHAPDAAFDGVDAASSAPAAGRHAVPGPDARQTDVPLQVPSLRRRMACFVYEGVLLFGLVTAVGLIYGLVTQQRHALHGSQGLRLTLFLVLGLYFVHFWSRSGQTLAMLTWHIRLVTVEGGPVSPARAALRYVAAWIWFLPALLVTQIAGWRDGRSAALAVGAGIAVYALSSLANPRRQFWHDVLCRTQLLTQAPTRRKDTPHLTHAGSPR